jgi:hypothetical protein
LIESTRKMLDFNKIKDKMSKQNNLQSLSNSSEEMQLIENILTEETRKLVGYIMPILEAEQISSVSKVNIKAIIWNYKNNLEKSIKQSEHYDKFNK